MTALSFLLFQASAPIPLKFFFLVGGVVVLIVAIIIVAYRNFLKSPEPSDDDLSALHIGPTRTVAPAPTPSPATRKEKLPVQQSASLSSPAPVENKVVPPPVATPPARPPAPPPPIVMNEAPAPTPVIVAPPPPVAVPQTRPLSRDTSMLREELPSSAPRTLSPPRVFSATTPRQEAPVAPSVDAPVVSETEPELRPQYQPVRTNQSEVFGSLTEVQKNQSRGNRMTLIILLIALIGIFYVAFTQVPLFHDTVMGAYDKVTGHNPPPPPVAQTPKIEVETKVAYNGSSLFVDGKVRNISDGPLDNIYAEVSITHSSGKLSETRLVPIFAGTAAAKSTTQTGKDGAQPPPKEDASLPPSQNGNFSLSVPGGMFRDAQLKRILKEDGTEVMFQKK